MSGGTALNVELQIHWSTLFGIVAEDLVWYTTSVIRSFEGEI